MFKRCANLIPSSIPGERCLELFEFFPELEALVDDDFDCNLNMSVSSFITILCDEKNQEEYDPYLKAFSAYLSTRGFTSCESQELAEFAVNTDIYLMSCLWEDLGGLSVLCDILRSTKVPMDVKKRSIEYAKFTYENELKRAGTLILDAIESISNEIGPGR